VLRENLSQCQFVHYKSTLHGLGSNPGRLVRGGNLILDPFAMKNFKTAIVRFHVCPSVNNWRNTDVIIVKFGTGWGIYQNLFICFTFC
jgi:hypothetical protein